MDMIAISLFLGILQGLSEFLPISSSGHLVIAPWLFNFADPGLSFDVALHVGTLIAVLSYFFRDWQEIGRALFGKGVASDRPEYTRSFFWCIIFATVPGIVVGLLIGTFAETALRSPLLVAATLFLGGALLYFADRYFDSSKNLSTLTFRPALFIGLAQALALIPGVSRSGITMTAARMLGFDRVSAARFSFLLSTPIILGAALLKLPDILSQANTLSFWVGVLASAVSGYIAIKYLIRFLERYGFAVFFWYRTALALLIVILFSVR